MSFCKLKSFVKIFFLFCLVIIMLQEMFLYCLSLDVEGETTLLYTSIDLYTQKEPYSGRGANQPSDAFAPQDDVVLYAHVTYRDYPVPGKIVAFEVHGPINPVKNLTFTRTALTNVEGVANVSFRIPGLSDYAEEVIFGVWYVIAATEIAEAPINDTLTFKVGWIVEVLNVETVGVDNVSRSVFMRNENMCFRLTVRNIAMVDKITTLVLDVYDCLNISLGQVVLEDEIISPGVTVFFVKDLLIPEWTSLGVGVVYANAYTALPILGGVPWCPHVYTTFSIVKVIVHDIAIISVMPSVNEIFPCQRVNISVVVRNEGDVSETFDVGCYYNSVLIEKLTVENLPPWTEKALTFSWCTCCVHPGNYTVGAEASVVPGEIDIDDNKFVDGVVCVKPWMPLPLPVECVLPRWLLAFLLLLAILVGVCLVLLIGLALWWSKNKKEGEREHQTAPTVKLNEQAVFKTTKTCNVCGREFPGVYTFCPYCLTFHGKDY